MWLNIYFGVLFVTAAIPVALLLYFAWVDSGSPRIRDVRGGRPMPDAKPNSYGYDVERRPNAFNRLIDAICFRLCNGNVRMKPTFQISKLKLNPGDRLVVRFDGTLSQVHLKNLRAMIEPELPTDVRAIVIDKMVELSVLAAPAPTENRSAA